LGGNLPAMMPICCKQLQLTLKLKLYSFRQFHGDRYVLTLCALVEQPSPILRLT